MWEQNGQLFCTNILSIGLLYRGKLFCLTQNVRKNTKLYYSFYFSIMSEEQPLQMMAENDSFQDDFQYNPVGEYTEGFEIYYSNQMTCPIPDCDFEGTFNRKAKYWRHWEERHVKVATKLECCYSGCKTVLRRQSDMRSHFKDKHKEFDDQLIESIMLKCKSVLVLVTNKHFVAPGFFIFKGRTPESLASPSPAVKSTVSKPKTKSSSKKSSLVSKPKTKSSSKKSSLKSAAQSVDSVEVQPVITPLSVSPLPAITPVIPAKPSSEIVPYALSSEPMELEDDPEFLVKIPSTLPSKLTSAAAVPCSSQLVLASSVSSSVPAVPETSRIIVQELASLPTYSSPAVSVSSSTTKISMEEYKARPKSSTPSLPATAFILPSLTYSSDNSTQTSLMDVKEVYLPPLPDTIPELQELLRYLCDNMDRIGRLREAAKQKLTYLQLEEPSLQKERELRKKLESENRDLQRQLAEMKWREETFRSVEL